MPGVSSGGGFTLVEMAVVLAVATLLVSLGVPSTLSYLQKSRRSDAVVALTRLQQAQEQFRSHHGVYSVNASALKGASATRSEGGYYDIELVQVQGQRYQARATARADAAQARDSDCAQLTLAVTEGLVEFGPSARCWNR
jgi:type IV pilus assembly protein PilE